MADEEILSHGQLYDYLQNYVKKLNVTTPKFYLSRACKKGDNFVSMVRSLRIEAVENGKTKNIYYILKTPLENAIMESVQLYRREIFFYREILPIFKENLMKRGRDIDFFPTLYDVSEESGSEAIILENLTCKEFVMRKVKIMDYPHAALTLRCLGEFHACSFITRIADPIRFEKLKKMKEPIFFPKQNTEVQSSYQKAFRDIVMTALKDEDKHYVERFRQFSINITQHMIDATNGSAAEPYAVLNHGDVWTNNILFKYDQKSQDSQENPCDLRFLDFQLCRYASPALDLVYLLFCCCTQEIRSKYYDQLLNEYYETLAKRLESYGYDPKSIFPYEALSQHLKKFGKFGAGMAIYVLHIFTDNKAQITDISPEFDVKCLEKRLQSDSFYRDMIKGTFKDLIDKNYI